MPNLEERLEAVVAQSEVDGTKWHTIVHGDDMTTVQTESGNVPSVAKQLKDVRAEIINGLEDYVDECRQAKADTLQIKSETQIIKNETNTLKGQTKTLRDEAETFKELSHCQCNGRLNITGSVGRSCSGCTGHSPSRKSSNLCTKCGSDTARHKADSPSKFKSSRRI